MKMWGAAALLLWCFLRVTGAEIFSSPLCLAPVPAPRHRTQGSKFSRGGFPTTVGVWLCFPRWLSQHRWVRSKGKPQETGFIKGFPHCALQEETTDLPLEEGPASLCIPVSIIAMLEEILNLDISWKETAVVREWHGLLPH